MGSPALVRPHGMLAAGWRVILNGLEPRGAVPAHGLAEQEKLVGRQSRQDVPGRNQNVLYRADPRQPLEGNDAIGVLCFDLHQGIDGAVELVNGELEPQLVLLMNDDEQQFVIRTGLQFLRREKLLQPEITGVCVLHGA